MERETRQTVVTRRKEVEGSVRIRSTVVFADRSRPDLTLIEQSLMWSSAMKPSARKNKVWPQAREKQGGKCGEKPPRPTTSRTSSFGRCPFACVTGSNNPKTWDQTYRAK